VQHDGHVVLREHQILLEKIRAERVRVGLRRERVLGQITARAAMRDDEWPRFRRHRDSRHAQKPTKNFFKFH